MKCRNCEKEFEPEGNGNWAFCSGACRHTYKRKSIRKRKAFSAPKINQNVTVYLSQDQFVFLDEIRGNTSRSAFIRAMLNHRISKEVVE